MERVVKATAEDRAGAAAALRTLAAAIERHPDLQVRGQIEAVRWQYPSLDDIKAEAYMRVPDARPVTITVNLDLDGGR